MYSPYIIMNKTLLPFDLAAKTWTGGQKPVAGSDLFKSESSLRYRELADGLQMTTIETPLRHSVRFQPLSQEPPLILPFVVFGYPNEDRRNRLFLKVQDSRWSKVSQPACDFCVMAADFYSSQCPSNRSLQTCRSSCNPAPAIPTTMWGCRMLRGSAR